MDQPDIRTKAKRVISTTRDDPDKKETLRRARRLVALRKEHILAATKAGKMPDEIERELPILDLKKAKEQVIKAVTDFKKSVNNENGLRPVTPRPSSGMEEDF